ncbi:adenylate kinase [Coniophora puteana RWD-64-598 SS2]|uniref:GTP:AMP phosphotransferase, mitochondrial n=1 Tax=Coniophora puteana (strain RWD-64-598) TaxID=741705 RepID=A0A5M3N2K5_CONPW|nr:adenylate kinase [Coniophora puteana RWD-64-598 SS2]EIW85141.1 adenylate kinase [Coniophora puteana RWD-64-598 SS2]
MISFRAARLPPSVSMTGPTRSLRCISSSASVFKALPFFLNNLRSGTDEQGPGKHLRMLMFGKPGAGKGTLSGRLVQKYDILSLSTGDLLRQHIAEKTEIGRQAEEIVAQGLLLPDELMLKVVTSRLSLVQNRHWILDGFPRTLGQGKLLDEHLLSQNTPLSLVVNLEVPDDVILGRITDRWIHLPSGRVYNLSYNRPKVDGFDDETGEPLSKRPDDNEEVFSRRLKQFYDSTSPLLSYYSSHTNSTRLMTLKGHTSDEIWPRLEATVLGAAPGLRERPAWKKHSLSEAVLERKVMVAGKPN